MVSPDLKSSHANGAMLPSEETYLPSNILAKGLKNSGSGGTQY